MRRSWAVACVAMICVPAVPVFSQEIFSNGFEDASICAWSNADQTDEDEDLVKICQFDCDDQDADIKPGGIDLCGDGKDNDCTGFADEACCSPLLQNCAATDACYYILATHTFACAAPFGMPPGQQEDPCMFQNSCAEGFGCTLCIPPDCDQEDLVCAAFCDPLGDDCQVGETCLLYNQFWGDVDPVPKDFGMCVADTLIP